MSISSLIVLGALPIREKPNSSPRSEVIAPELAFFGALAFGLLIVAGVVLFSLGKRRGRRPELDEQRAWAVMDELCRGGWTAQLTLYGSGARLPADAPDVPGIKVRIDWAELSDEGSGDSDIAVARRFWSRSVAAALNTMVEDRRIDFQLEQIERAHPPEA